MEKYVRVMDGIKSNAGGFEYKLDEINISDNWNPNERESEKIGGFNFTTEDKILRWLHRGDTIYDVIIPEDAEIILFNEEKGIYRTNKIIDSIRLLGNCSNKSNYEYTDEEVKKIFAAIELEIREAKSKYQSKSKNKKFEL